MWWCVRARSEVMDLTDKSKSVVNVVRCWGEPVCASEPCRTGRGRVLILARMSLDSCVFLQYFFFVSTELKWIIKGPKLRMGRSVSRTRKRFLWIHWGNAAPSWWKWLIASWIKPALSLVLPTSKRFVSITVEFFHVAVVLDLQNQLLDLRP